MKRRPKNKNEVKLKGIEASKANSVAAVAVQMGVHRSSVYRSRKQNTKLEGDKKNGSKFYVNPKAYEAQRVLHPDSARHAQGVKNA
ncbi:hypothetical protein F444_01661 [Phytophthora nicotianae P1976]|uniref:Uncharacterized protein n=1 Tax=Phytophthora nicotianae P1976 TaxID=1317066 RepID=A0A081AZX7_PHYNI|nr:hypothetical protein F444_01661 [Phytophthora nicotianae P1976]